MRISFFFFQIQNQILELLAAVRIRIAEIVIQFLWQAEHSAPPRRLEWENLRSTCTCSALFLAYL